MSDFIPALQLVLRNEGLLEDNKLDLGGITAFGISYRFYKAKVNPNATPDDIRNLTIEQATNIYRKYFWDRQAFSFLNNQKLANKVFDLTINTNQGVTFLQKAINKLDLCAHLVIDNALGPKTAAKANSLPVDDLYILLLGEARNYYLKIAKNGNNSRFLQGWLGRLMSI